jgi:hypothetical protein
MPWIAENLGKININEIKKMSTEITTTEEATDVKKVEKKETTIAKGERVKASYILWRSIPAMLKILPKEDQKRMGYDVDDPMFQILLSLKTKAEFCKAFDINVNQPARWEADDNVKKEIDKRSITDHVMRFRKDVDFSFTQKVLRHGDAHRMKLWKQLYEGWTEKIDNRNTNINFDMVEIVKAIEERNAKIRGD